MPIEYGQCPPPDGFDTWDAYDAAQALAKQETEQISATPVVQTHEQAPWIKSSARMEAYFANTVKE